MSIFTRSYTYVVRVAQLLRQVVLCLTVRPVGGEQNIKEKSMHRISKKDADERNNDAPDLGDLGSSCDTDDNRTVMYEFQQAYISKFSA
jgi:hypothetical protein